MPITAAEQSKVRPLAGMLGVVLGSAVAIFAGLTLTLVVYLLLPDQRERLSGEFVPLLKAVGLSGLLALAAAAAFIGEMQSRSWRRPALLLLAIVLVGFGWAYWP